MSNSGDARSPSTTATRSTSASGAAAWPTCSSPATCCSTARWRSRCCSPSSPSTRTSSSASAARPRRPPTSATPTSSTSTTGASTTAPTSSPWSTCRAARWPRSCATNGQLTAKQAAEIASEVAAALGFAHEAGLAHRDIKPANILIGTNGQVKVADFGIARAMNSATEIEPHPGRLGDGHGRRTSRPSRPRAPSPTRAATCTRSAS